MYKEECFIPEVIDIKDIIEADSFLLNKPKKCEMPGCDRHHHLMGLCWYHFIFDLDDSV